MPFTITVPDRIASAIQTAANDCNVSPRQLVLHILAEAVGLPGDWQLVNRRRLGLIERQFTNSLTPDEATELQSLQLQADEHLESVDAEMLKGISEMEKAAMQALNS